MEYEVVVLEAIESDFLDTFERYQVTEKICYVDDNNIILEKEEKYTEKWDKTKKESVIENLRGYLYSGGSVVAIKNKDVLIGFAGIEGKVIGEKKEYFNLGYIHISYPYRGKGFGKILFNSICQQSRIRGAKKLYIGTNPSINTYYFYKSLGCVLSKEIVKEIYEQEPLDLQLEYVL